MKCPGCKRVVNNIDKHVKICALVNNKKESSEEE